MSDLISRQAVLKIINKVIIRYDELKPKYELIIIKSAMEKMADEIVKDLAKFPSVEPEKSECPWYGEDKKCHFAEDEIEKCDDCISRTEALEILDDYAEDIERGNWGTAYSKARASMCEIPSVEPERKPSGWNKYDDDDPKTWPEDGSWGLWLHKSGALAVLRWKQDAQNHFYPDPYMWNIEKVVAWMPLPDPYEPQESEDK